MELEPIQSFLIKMEKFHETTDKPNTTEKLIRDILTFLPARESETRCADPEQQKAFSKTLEKMNNPSKNSNLHPAYQVLQIASQIWSLVAKNCPACANTDCKFRDK
ncbi:MAG: hypothetical protein WC806_06250 [Candidatus Gracilibacteria bacterium]|jgi:hypothetical protein